MAAGFSTTCAASRAGPGRGAAANMTESSSMGSSAQACGGRGREMRRGGGEGRGRRHEDGAENRRMSLTGLCLASPSPRDPLSLPLPSSLQPSAYPAIPKQKPTGKSDPSVPRCQAFLLLAALTAASLSPFSSRSPGAPFLRAPPGPRQPHSSPAPPSWPGVTTMCTGGRVCSMLSGCQQR